jgi:Tol biopolymer transport system component
MYRLVLPLIVLLLWGCKPYFDTPVPDIGDEEKIVFENLEDDRLYMINPDGKDLQKINITPVYACGVLGGWIDNERLFFYYAEDRYIVDFKKRRTYKVPSWWHLNISSWSNDGKKAIFDENNDIYLLDTRSKKKKKITNTPDLNESESCISPDGKRIAFRISTGREETDGIYIMNIDGTGMERLIYYPRGINFSFSPDGKMIVFITRKEEDKTYKLYLIDIEKKKIRRITNDNPERTEGFFSWAPDSKRIVFIGGRPPREKWSQDNWGFYVVDIEYGTVTLICPEKEDFRPGNPFWRPRPKKGGE